MNRITAITMMLMALLVPVSMGAQTVSGTQTTDKEKLVVVWTSGDVEVAEKMVFMYVYNARKAGWFDEVTFIIWGPSAKLLSENEKLQERVKAMQDAGIKTEACIACASMYGVVDSLKNLGVDVKGMGVPLSNYLKEGSHVMTF